MRKLVFIIFVALSARSVWGSLKHKTLFNSDSEEEDLSLGSAFGVQQPPYDTNKSTIVEYASDGEEWIEDEFKRVLDLKEVRVEEEMVKDDADNIPLIPNQVVPVAPTGTTTNTVTDTNTHTAHTAQTDSNCKDPSFMPELIEYLKLNDLEESCHMEPIYGNIPVLIVHLLLKNNHRLPGELLNIIAAHFGDIDTSFKDIIMLKFVNKEFSTLVETLLKHTMSLVVWEPKSRRVRNLMMKQIFRGRGKWLEMAPKQFPTLFDRFMMEKHPLEYQLMPVEDCLTCRPHGYMFNNYTRYNCTLFNWLFGCPQAIFTMLTIGLVVLAFLNETMFTRKYQIALYTLGTAFTLFGNCIIYVCYSQCFSECGNGPGEVMVEQVVVDGIKEEDSDSDESRALMTAFHNQVENEIADNDD